MSDTLGSVIRECNPPKSDDDSGPLGISNDDEEVQQY